MENFGIGKHYRTWTDRNRQAVARKSSATPRLSDAECPKCKHITCLGCGQNPNMTRAPIKVGGHNLSWCCNDGRLFSIWCVAGYFDDRLYDDLQEAKRESAKTQAAKPQAPSYGPPRMYNASANIYAANGMFNPYERYDVYGQMYGGPDGGMGTQLKVANKETDSRNETLMSQLATLMSDKNTPFKLCNFSPTVLPAVFYLSFALDAVAELLRNDSVDDAAKRQGTYLAALAFAERLFQHAMTRNLITDKRYIKKTSQGLVMLTVRGGKELVLDDFTSGRGSSVGSVMESMQTQCRMILKTYEKMPQERNTPENVSLMKICKKVQDIAGQFGATTMQSIVVGRESNWEKFHSGHRVISVADDVIIHGHCYAKYRSDKTTTLPGRMSKLVKEIANMQTSLPSGISLKFAQSRPDYMKLLVIGTTSTPYQNGIFEFDVWAGMRYPQESPKVWFPPQPCRDLRINPNIHEDGKVCLTILGTWPGAKSEMWQPGISSLYQVFLSMQMLILNDNPIANEPGYDKVDKSHPHAIKYAQRLEAINVSCAILPWLSDRAQDKRSQQAWGEIVRPYFKMNHADIAKTVRRFAESNPLITNCTGMRGYGPSSGKTNRTNIYGNNLVQAVETALNNYLK
ncbi:MAG: hypothetical protein M1828_004873 [Chrysothrix sp. TS-e1954]|nr:MAG: hypothetical protein M1828_004873 [Chrysothrix sp. TS-e1954]